MRWCGLGITSSSFMTTSPLHGAPPGRWSLWTRSLPLCRLVRVGRTEQIRETDTPAGRGSDAVAEVIDLFEAIVRVPHDKDVPRPGEQYSTWPASQAGTPNHRRHALPLDRHHSLLSSWPPSSRPIASAATACIVAVTCEYKSKVMPIWLWPSRSLTILGCTPSLSSSVAQP